MSDSRQMVSKTGFVEAGGARFRVEEDSETAFVTYQGRSSRGCFSSRGSMFEGDVSPEAQAVFRGMAAHDHQVSGVQMARVLEKELRRLRSARDSGVPPA